MRYTFLLLASLILLSCTPRPPEELQAAEPELPTMVLEEATYRFSTRNIVPILVKAAQITIDNRQHLAVLERASFTQQGDGGIRGSSDLVTIDTQTNDVTLAGNVHIAQPSGGFAISAETISWNNGQQVLSSAPDGVVEVTFDGSGTITGSGFRGDLSRDSYEFARIDQGEVQN